MKNSREEMLTKPPVERLSDFEKAKIAKIAELSFNDMDWGEIEVARYDFASIFRTKARALEGRRVAMRLKAIANCFDDAIDALTSPQRSCDGNHISVHRKTLALLARELSADRSATKLAQSFLQLIALRFAARHAQLKSIEDSHKNYSRHRWTALIHTLASIFEAHGCKPTAAKWTRASEPRASLFVKFVRAVLETLPSDVNEHLKTEVALSKSVSDGLKFHWVVRRIIKAGHKDTAR